MPVLQVRVKGFDQSRKALVDIGDVTGDVDHARAAAVLVALAGVEVDGVGEAGGQELVASLSSRRRAAVRSASAVLTA